MSRAALCSTLCKMSGALYNALLKPRQGMQPGRHLPCLLVAARAAWTSARAMVHAAQSFISLLAKLMITAARSVWSSPCGWRLGGAWPVDSQLASGRLCSECLRWPARRRYVRQGVQHSWNANWLFSNACLFRLQRHSDHHAHAARPYQACPPSSSRPMPVTPCDWGPWVLMPRRPAHAVHCCHAHL